MTAYAALLVSVLFRVLSQTLQKQVADALTSTTVGAVQSVRRYLHLPKFWLALLCLGIAMLSWLLVLANMEVSKAYSLLSVNYVAMLFISRTVFHEAIPPSRWLAVACLLAGLLLIFQS
jgi:undecaprenyl phosphate-alpha-L-ara4N flippase subunit ArnE